jgi:NADPH:quinone reductase-like Zn-dependent oxidoreductase
MNALVLSDKNQPLVVKEVADPVLSQGEALILVHAAALNHRDLWIQKGMYAGLKYPAILGSDGAGEVHAIVDSANESMVGKEVLIYPSLNWGEEESHQHPKEFRILGMPDHGTFAEYVKVPLNNLAAKPAHLSFQEAAALPLAGVTAYRAVFSRGRLKAGEKILITGIGGGVALFALQFAKAVHAVP